MTDLFKQYIRAIVGGPNLALTTHDAVTEGSISFGKERRLLWLSLVKEMGGFQQADAAVRFWLNNPVRMD